jgi:hypothetical protein
VFSSLTAFPFADLAISDPERHHDRKNKGIVNPVGGTGSKSSGRRQPKKRATDSEIV